VVGITSCFATPLAGPCCLTGHRTSSSSR